MKNMVHDVVILAFWITMAAQALEFFSGYFEPDLSECRTAESHYVLKDSWYAHGCKFGGK